MKHYFYGVLSGVLIVILIVGICWFKGCFTKTEYVEIETEIEKPQQIKQKPGGNQKEDWRYWKTLSESQLKITGDIEEEWLNIRCEDDHKWKDKSFKLVYPTVWKKNLFPFSGYALIGYNSGIKKTDVLLGGSIGYIRMTQKWAGIGGSLIYLHGMISENSYYGVQITILLQF